MSLKRMVLRLDRLSENRYFGKFRTISPLITTANYSNFVFSDDLSRSDPGLPSNQTLTGFHLSMAFFSGLSGIF